MNPTLTKMMILVGVNDMPQLCFEVHIILVDCLLRLHNASRLADRLFLPAK